MSTSLKGITAAVTTTGLAATLTASLLIGNAASASDGVSTTVTTSDEQLASFSTHLTAQVFRAERKGQRYENRLRERERARRREAARRHRAAQRRHRAAARRHRQLMAARPSGTPQQMAETLVSQHGWDSSQWSCLDELWTRESGWNVSARNASSGAYGIPQALPATKMAEAGSDYMTDPLTQIRWGIDYIAADYGTPCGALEHSNETGYY